MMAKHTVRLTMALALAIAFLAAGMKLVRADQKPYPVPNMLRHGWQLNFTWHKPQRIFVAVGHGIHPQMRKYWFLRYTVTNRTHRDIFFIPSFVLVTGTGKVLRPVVGVPTRVIKKIRRITGDPFIIRPGLIPGKVLQGADNAKDGVAIFANVPSGARHFKFFIGGLSGDTAVQKDPLNNKDIVLHKTLLLKYWIPGQSVRMAPHPQFQGRVWVMR